MHRSFTNHTLKIAGAALLAALLGGCVTYYTPRHAEDGVYYGDGGQYAHRRSAVIVDPVYYPYWSLDYFYFSYYYHPYSVLYSRDPFFRHYPGWYYGYRPGTRFHSAFGFGYWYPWYAGGFYYHYYRPWYGSHHYAYHYHHHARPAIDRRARAVGGPNRSSRGRDLYGAQQEDVQQSFARRALYDSGLPRPYDRTPAVILTPARTPTPHPLSARTSTGRIPVTARPRGADTAPSGTRLPASSASTQPGRRQASPQTHPPASSPPLAQPGATRSPAPPVSAPSPGRQSSPPAARPSPSREPAGQDRRRR